VDNKIVEPALRRTHFGRRNLVPRVCVSVSKPHVRKFLCKALEDLGFTTCECAHSSEVAAIYAAETPDLFLIGFLAEGAEVAEILERLEESGFNGEVLLVGPQKSLALPALRALGEKLGLQMMSPLTAPYSERELRESLAKFIPSKELLRPPVDVAEALHEGWLELWYQPKIDLRTLSVFGAEGLIRIRHPRWGVVSPAYFIPVDGDPHFGALSEFVIQQAMVDWHTFVSENASFEIAVNLPFSFLTSTELLKTLDRLLPKHPAFRGIIAEINGTEILRNLEKVKDIADQLKLRNVGISINDLGAEWPMLLAQNELPFVELKVDLKFIAGCASDRLKQTVCRRILELSSGMRTVAEGIETRADFLAVREMGFDAVQGYYVGKPMEPKNFAAQILHRGPLQSR
jgi:EAL domain-containing protein (putative c-di-GMP-specific phosphodiesterase class I)/CheY-like chemotaxis protein